MLSRPNILVCTDFSEFSNHALKAAEKIRALTNGTIEVLHVSEIQIHWEWVSSGLATSYIDEQSELNLLQQMQSRVDKQIEQCKVQGSGHVSMGYPFSVIQETIKEKDIDLVIMGKKGRAASPFHLGSLTEKMVGAAEIPVLVMKQDFDSNKIAGLVDPTGPKGSIKHVIEATEELAYLLSARPVIVSLFQIIEPRFYGIGKLGVSTQLLSLSEKEKEEVSKDIRDRITTFLSGKSKAEIKVGATMSKSVSQVLNEMLASDATDLVVMERHQKGFLEKLMLGSQTRRMLETFKGNLFILPPEKE